MNFKYEKAKLYDYMGERLVNICISNNVILAGGAITSLFNNKDINDLDLYFRSKESCIETVDSLQRNGIWLKCMTDKAALTNVKGVDVQFIFYQFPNNANELFETYDFTINMGAYDFKTEEFIFDDRFFKHNISKKIEINRNTSFPIMTLLRLDKYKQKGFEVCKSEVIKLATMINNIEVNNWDELKEQVGGMYGVKLDDLFDSSSEFNFDNIIDSLCDIELKHGFNSFEDDLQQFDFNEFVYNITNQKIKYFQHKNRYFKINTKGEYIKISQPTDDSFYKEINKNDAISVGDKFYKYVKKTESDDTYSSFFKPEFKYKIGEVINGGEKGIFCGQYSERKGFTYRDEKDSVLIELELLSVDDFYIGNNWYSEHDGIKKGRVVKVVDNDKA